MSLLIPTVTEKCSHGSTVTYDLYSKLLKERIIFVGDSEGYVTTESANILIAQLLYLDSNSNKNINLYINSPGGMITAGFAVYDTMKFIKSPITTICMGMAMSFGAVLLAAGTKGKRFAFVHSRIMIHQPLICGLSGTVSDVNIETNELIYIKEKLSEIIAKHTKRTIRQVSKDVDRNCYMSAYEAKKYGLIDSVVTNLK